MTLTIFFLVLLFIVAFLYAAVGHGGASGYLALMAVFGMLPEIMKPTALLLNLFVSLSAFLLFYKEGHFKWKIFLPFALASIPFSFLGGVISLDATIYKKILGILLLIPVVRLAALPNKDMNDLKQSTLFLSLFDWCLYRFFIRIDWHRWRHHPVTSIAVARLDKPEADGRHQCVVHFRKFTVWVGWPTDQRNQFSI